MLARQDHALQVHLENAVPGFLLHVRRAGVPPADADVVVEDVDAAVGVDRRSNQGLAVGLAGGGGAEGAGAATLLSDHLHRLLGGVESDVRRHHLGSLAGEEQGRRAAIPDGVAGCLAGTDHDGDLAFEASAHGCGKRAAPDSSCTPSVLSAIETRVYWPTVKTRSISCRVS